MDASTFELQWPQLRGQLKAWWGRLAEADLDKVAGQKDQLVALVQATYGYTRERAQQEVERRLQEYGHKLGTPGLSQAADTVATAAQEVASSLAGTVGDIQATAKATAATAATMVADTVTGTGAHLQEKGVEGLTGELAAWVRRYPIASLLIGLGVGFLLGCSLGKTTTAQGS
jgi:uncharacterized protein YjbJ (UPF0337 family)